MFQARFSRREAGGYDCRFGKGERALTAVLEQSDKLWWVTQGFASDPGLVKAGKKIADVKEAWGVLAEAAYGGSAPAVLSTPKPGPPSLRKPVPVPEVTEAKPVKAGPPSLRLAGLKMEVLPTPEYAAEEAPKCPHCSMPFNGWTWVAGQGAHKRLVPPCRCNLANEPDYSPDPFDKNMWLLNHETRKYDILSPLGALDVLYRWMMRNSDYCKTDGVLDAPWASVQETLWRELGYAEYRIEVWS